MLKTLLIIIRAKLQYNDTQSEYMSSYIDFKSTTCLHLFILPLLKVANIRKNY